ncbi:MAG: hydratase [Acidobacteria bacterium]|nr:hydratase [Acidobacteriota bacterium]MXW39378.1 hydratase [Acidobacteriota bacterium]MYA46045.1 hydratase [Acidobacteriota bacterium]MYI39407.1 hydratase [Acidobacteriota bacterium]
MTDPSFDPIPIAEEIIAARAAGARLTPFTDRVPGFGFDEAYQVAGIIACRRASRSPVIGRKIGFTNPSLWEKAGLGRPVWGNMYEETVTRAGPAGETPAGSMAGSVEPKIECEVVVVLRSVPERGDRGAAVARHVAEIGLGFEIVDSPYPGWNMTPADAVAAGGLHHRLAVGPLVPVTDPEATVAAMAALTVSMTRAAAADPKAAEHVADGEGRMVLGNPLDAVAALVEMAADHGSPLAAGEVVTTGSLTPPLPAVAGEFYRAEAGGGALPPASVVLK